MFVHTTTIRGYSCKKGSLINEKLKQDEIIGSEEFITKITKEPTRLGNKNIMCLVCLAAEKDEKEFWKEPFQHYLTLEMRPTGLYLYNSWQYSFSNEWFSGLMEEDPVLKTLKIDNQEMLTNFRNKCGNGTRLANPKEALECFTLINFEPHSFYFLCEPLKKKFEKLN